MSVLILVIPMALLLGAGFIFAFFWATSDGQFDDLSTPAMRMLEKDPEPFPTPVNSLKVELNKIYLVDKTNLNNNQKETSHE